MIHSQDEPKALIEKHNQGYRARIRFSIIKDGEVKQKNKTRTLKGKSMKQRRAEAEEFLEELKLAGIIGVVGAGQIDFITLFGLWKKSPSMHGLSETTFSKYINCLEKFVIPQFGSYKLREIRSYMVERFFYELIAEERAKKIQKEKERQEEAKAKGESYRMKTPEEFSYNGSHDIYKAFAHIMNYAKKERYIEDSPVTSRSKPIVRGRKVDNFLTKEQLELLPRYLSQKSKQLFVLYSLSVTVGLRRGELAGLEWSDIDLEKNEIVIKRAAKKKRRDISHNAEATIIGSLKSQGSQATIPISKSVVKTLKEFYEEECERREMLADKWIEKDYFYVFSSEKGTRYHPDTLTKKWRTMLNDFIEDYGDGGVLSKRATLHGLRHTSVSILLNAGIPIVVVQKHARHSKIGLTVDTYGHLEARVHKEAVKVYDKLFENNKEDN